MVNENEFEVIDCEGEEYFEIELPEQIQLLIVSFGEDFVQKYFETDLFGEIETQGNSVVKVFNQTDARFSAIALHHAALIENKSAVKKLVQQCGVLVDVVDNRGMTPLMNACCRAYKKSVDTLIDLGACLAAKDNEGRGLAHYSIFSRNLSFLKAMYKKGVVFDLASPVDEIIPIAGAECDVKTLRWLIEELGGDVNIITKEGDTALANACLWECYDNALYLIGKGANPSKSSAVVFTPVIKRIQELQLLKKSKTVSLEIERELKRLTDFAKKV